MSGRESITVGPRVRTADGVEIATYNFGGDGPPLMLAHATGFHGRCWLPMAQVLTDRFSVWAVDHRGHGDSGKDPRGRYDDWSVFVDDLLVVLDELGGDEWRAIGHSMGGAVLLLAEARRPGTFVSLCCYEPVVMPPTALATGAANGGSPMVEIARKRRAVFASKAAARRNFASKPPFSRFHPAALDAYVEYGFVESEGGVTLACAREDEASVYEGAPTNGAWDRLGSVRVPVTVLGGQDPADPVGRIVEDVARRIPRGAALRVEGVGHFGPFEEPELVGELAAEGLGAGRGRSPTTVSAPG
ncbi:MAG TPA: alpha/beta hydrolase [Acidimicrobiales bacterium]|nr:alpha/beta hydrolase [Acidimicrobiales bacterium]